MTDMSSQPERSDSGPVDRLTRICDAMTQALEAHPEASGNEKCIVFLDDGDRGGIMLLGYDDDTEAMADLLVHLRAIFRASGKDLKFVALGQG